MSGTKVEISKFGEVCSSLSCNDLERAGLYDYGFRDYDPLQMRFTTVDPIKSGLNWYAYCGNDPVNFIDPLGLELVVLPDPSNPDYKSRTESDLEQLKKDNLQVKTMIEDLEASSQQHFIRMTPSGDSNRTIPDDRGDALTNNPTGSTINYDPYDEYSVTRNKRTPRVALAHELDHSSKMDTGEIDYAMYNGIPKYEIDAINTENFIRDVTGDKMRTQYDGKTIPGELLDPTKGGGEGYKYYEDIKTEPNNCSK